MGMNREELTRFLKTSPLRGYAIEAIEDAEITVTIDGEALEARPGGTIAGPSLVKAADVTAWLLLLALDGLKNVMAFTINLNASFLRPAALGSVLVRATLLGRTNRIATIAVSLRAAHEAELVAQATVTYSTPRDKAPSAGPDVPLSPEDIASILGVYRYEGALEGRSFEVFGDDGRVQMVEVDAATGRRFGTAFHLRARSASDFEGVEIDTSLRFDRKSDGSVTGLSQNVFGETFTAKRAPRPAPAG